MLHPRQHSFCFSWPLLVMVAITAAHLPGQCATQWSVGATSLPNAMVRAMTSWDPDGPGPQPSVVVIGGSFTAVGATAANLVAAYDPVLGTWSALPGMPAGGAVVAFAVMSNGELVAGGSFLGAGGVADNVARWNGSSWTSLGPGLTAQQAVALLALSNGNLIVGGTSFQAGGTPAFGIAQWNGASWSALPGLGSVGHLGLFVRAIAEMSNGDIVAGGMFTCPGGAHLARWNGTGWTAMSTGTDFVSALLALPNNHLVVARQFVVERWDGATWSSLGSPVLLLNALTALPNGDLIVGGGQVARWNGTVWSGFAPGLNSSAYALLNAPNGDLLVGGPFTTAGGVASPFLARLTTTCPATVASYGAGCAGSGGLNVLSHVTLPWIGSTFRARAVGMPPLALVLSVYGFTPTSIPFASVIPAALPGCTILMTGDLIDVLLPSGGVVQTQVALPNTAALVGNSFHHYVVPFEVDLALSITAITNSNALTCTVGSF